MWSSICGSTGVAGWIIMVTLWVALIATVVLAITRLFPDPPRRSGRR